MDENGCLMQKLFTISKKPFKYYQHLHVSVLHTHIHACIVLIFISPSAEGQLHKVRTFPVQVSAWLTEETKYTFTEYMDGWLVCEKGSVI
jgi:hypothetical protein